MPALAWIGAALVAVALFIQLVPMAARAVLNTDECFHAHVSRFIAAHGTPPTVIPELYGGLKYPYPPLLHYLGAAWVKTIGLATLPVLNTVLYAALAAALVLLPVPGLPSTARRWAMWLVLASVSLATYAIRFYAEMLTCLLGLGVTLLLLRVAATRRTRDAVLLGVVGGLAVLAKFSALLVPVLLLAYAGAEAVARRRDGARNGLIAAAITLAIAAPLLIRNQLVYGSPVYPGGAHDIDPWVMKLNQETFMGGVGFFLDGVKQTIGWWVMGIGAIGLLIAIATRRRDLHAGLLLCALLGIAVAPVSPLHDARHVMPLIPIVALSGCVILHDVLARRGMIRGVLEMGIAALSLVTVLTLGDRRTPLDVPPGLMEAYVGIREHVPANGTVLSLWTYDTFYHSGRAATWPIGWGQGDRSPAPLFRETDPDRFLAEMDRLGIDYLLVPRSPGDAVFIGNNYPRSLIDCVRSLLARRSLRIAWGSNNVALLQRLK